MNLNYRSVANRMQKKRWKEKSLSLDKKDAILTWVELDDNEKIKRGRQNGPFRSFQDIYMHNMSIEYGFI